MSTSIPQTQDTNLLQHALYVVLELDDSVYYITSNREPVTINGLTFTALGWLLSISDIQDDLKTNNGDLSLSLSGIPTDLITEVLNAPVKGGRVTVYRGFETAGNIQLYGRYKGVITNYAIEEFDDYLSRNRSYTVSITTANINTLLENTVAGQRTNGSDRKRFYPGDISFDRVKDLQNVNFDFGRRYNGGGGYGGGYTTVRPGGGVGPGGNPFINDDRRVER